MKLYPVGKTARAGVSLVLVALCCCSEGEAEQGASTLAKKTGTSGEGGSQEGGSSGSPFPSSTSPFPEAQGGQPPSTGGAAGQPAGQGGAPGGQGGSLQGGQAGSLQGGQGGSGETCGDGVCSNIENCKAYPADCGVCPAEVCDDGIDNDKDGQIDEGCPTEIVISPKPSDDCVCLQCPPEFPYVKSCGLSFTSGGDDPSSNSNCFELRDSGTVYAMQGKNCGTSSDYQGKVTGSIVCAKSPSGGTCKVSNAISCKSWSAASLKDSYNNCK